MDFPPSIRHQSSGPYRCHGSLETHWVHRLVLPDTSSIEHQQFQALSVHDNSNLRLAPSTPNSRAHRSLSTHLHRQILQLLADARKAWLSAHAQGFGRLQLESSLPLANDPNTVSKLFVVNSEPIDTGDVIDFCVSVERATAEELRATLVWHDPPALLGSRYQLVNDLDLQLKMLDPSQSVLGYEAKLYGNGRGSLDRVNNVERIRLQTVAPGAYVFEVWALGAGQRVV